MKTPSVGGPRQPGPATPARAKPGFEEALRAAGVTIGKPKKLLPRTLDDPVPPPPPPPPPSPRDPEG